MRFLALLRKELRESLPWMLLAAIVFLGIGSLGISSRAYQPRHFSEWTFSPGSFVDAYWFWHAYSSPLRSVGILLFLMSIALGLVLGVRQFWIPNFTRTWGFVLHRSVNKSTVLAAKLTAAVLTFSLSLGLVWIFFYVYASRPRTFPIPPMTRIFVEGLVLIISGLVVYLGTALSGLSRVRWYTTKMFGLGLAGCIILTVVVQWQLFWVFALMILGVLILLVQIIKTFINGEF